MSGIAHDSSETDIEFCRFLGPRMIYTSGIVTDINREETLEELQDNKLKVVCEKLNLQPHDRLLDIGHVLQSR